MDEFSVCQTVKQINSDIRSKKVRVFLKTYTMIRYTNDHTLERVKRARNKDGILQVEVGKSWIPVSPENMNKVVGLKR